MSFTLVEIIEKQGNEIQALKATLAGVVEKQDKEMKSLKEQFSKFRELHELNYEGRTNYLQQAFKLDVIKEGTVVKHGTVTVKVSVINERAVLFYKDKSCESFYQFLIAIKEPGQYKKLIIDGISYQAFLENLKDIKNSDMSFGSTTPPSAITEEKLPGNLTNNDNALLSEITTYFVDRGFQPSLVSSFLTGNSRLEFMTNEEIMLDFLDEREQMDPTIFVGVEGNEGVEPGEDKKLLVKWGLTEEASNRLRNGIHDSAWSQQFLKHWLLDWIYNRWDATNQLSFEGVFYDLQFPRNQWHSYDREGGPQMFASSFEEIVTIGEDALIKCNTKVANAMDVNYKAFFHSTKYENSQSISEIGIDLTCCRNHLDFRKNQSFYLNPSLDNAIDFIKKRWIVGFYGIVVYWVNMEGLRSMKYRDLTQDENLWREVVVASRCGQRSVVDNNDFVYGYQLSNPRQIRNAYYNRSNRKKDSWKNLIPMAKWFEPIRNIQLAVKNDDAVEIMNNYQVGVIYFHLKKGNK